MYNDKKFFWSLSMYIGDRLIETITPKPIFGDGVSLVGEMTSEQRFIRFQFNGDISFLKSDHDFINAGSYENMFQLNCLMYTQDSQIKNFSFSFYKSDCEIDFDNGITKVRLREDDSYTKILDNIGSEFNVIALTPEMARLSTRLRPVQQFYVVVGGFQDTKIMNLIGGMWWEQTVNNNQATESELLNTYKFSKIYEDNTIKVYGRALLGPNITVIGTARPINDITDYSYNYPRVAPLDTSSVPDIIRISTATTSEPTRWGIAENGRYFFKPTNTVAGRYLVPLGASLWSTTSIWFYNGQSWDVNIQKYDDSLVIRDNYKIGSVISAILKEIGSDVTHEETSDYSQFLYSTSNPVIYTQARLLLTPRSNVLKGAYDNPAKKALISLQTIFNMLRDVYQCYWYIENNRLKIEHISYFKNGMSYNSTPVINTDLTKLYNPRTQLPWSFGINKVSFDVSKLPQRYEFSWSDDCTEPFEYFPLRTTSNYIGGQNQEVNVGNFLSDIDYMRVMSNSVSNTNSSWALFGAIYSSGSYTLSYRQFTTPEKVVAIVQNWYASFQFAVENFYIYDFPSETMYVEEYETTIAAVDIKKSKQQECLIPNSVLINPYQLIKTDIGNGQIENISINLLNEIATATLVFKP